MKSPFKFLDPYNLKDKEAFFGRDTETRELFSLITKNRLTFIYGPSGTGKTSLVQCGLASRFKGVDWLPIFVRRGENINQSLNREIEKLTGQIMPVSAAIEFLFKKFLRPVYLVFDQFEELFILGDSDESKERQPFYDTIADLLDSDLPCRILFIMREDYFGHLNQFEKTVPELYQRKLRVEPMNRENLRQVVTGSCKVYDIAFGDEHRDPDRILDNILATKSTVQMPFVQVYLHNLYQEAAAQNPGNTVRFDEQVINALGPIPDVLARFLKDQETAIHKELIEKGFPAKVDTVRKVLDLFVSEEGTKIPVPYTIDTQGRIEIKESISRQLAEIPAPLVAACVEALEKNRLLRRSEEYLELSHDTLAAVIDQQRTVSQKQLKEVKKRLEIGYLEHLESKKTGGMIYYLDRGQMARIEPYRDQINMEKGWADFIKQCQANIELTENEAKVRAERELLLVQEKLEAEHQSLRKQRTFTRIVAAIAVLAVLASAYALIQRQRAENAKTEIAALGYQTQMEAARTLKVQGKYTEAINQLATAQKFATTPQGIQEATDLQQKWARIKTLAETAVAFSAHDKFLEAIAAYQSADEIDTDDFLKNNIQQTTRMLETDFAEYMKAAKLFEAGRRYDYAVQSYQYALALKPNDSAAKTGLERCEKIIGK